VRRRLPLAVLLTALVFPAAAIASEGTFVVVPDPQPASALASAAAANAAGEIAVDANFTTQPTWVEQRSVDELRPIWERAGAAYGIPWPVLAAINKIESNFGGNMGPSSAGAVGWMQFMPDTWLRWGMDADGDGVADPWDAEDAIFAAARYLAASGGTTDIARALFSYNHADWYVREVLALANVYAGGTIEAPAFDVTQSVDLTAVQARIDAANDALTRAVADQERLSRLAEIAQTRFADTDLLSDQLLAQKRLTLVGIRHDRAGALVEQLRAQLADAQTTLETARLGAFQTPFELAASPFTSAPTSDGYVFPVGGGAENVSTAATHHDYPAADIVAPAGSPVYALTDGVVLRGWDTPEGRCGIGFTMQATDGRQWTYCHLSYLEPMVSSGTALAAGSSVGLVGSTGTTSTGPHLHLQLAPPVSYPQAEAWFQSFAGTAFSWIGPPAPPATGGGGAVFTVVPDDSTSPAPSVIEFTKNP
jgi:murein DD-endopeptidase MepM/ murein hydrolase activator NlpD